MASLQGCAAARISDVLPRRFRFRQELRSTKSRSMPKIVRIKIYSFGIKFNQPEVMSNVSQGRESLICRRLIVSVGSDVIRENFALPLPASLDDGEKTQFQILSNIIGFFFVRFQYYKSTCLVESQAKRNVQVVTTKGLCQTRHLSRPGRECDYTLCINHVIPWSTSPRVSW